MKHTKVSLVINNFPEFEDLDIFEYPLTSGYYTFGLIKHHRPDIEIITPNDWVSYDSYKWLEARIQNALDDYKTVGVFIWDEDIGFNKRFTECVVKYQDKPVYVITQCDSFCMLNYKDLGIKNILEVPWWLLNECLIYYKFCSKDNLISSDTDHNFLCMVNRLQDHKMLLVDKLKQFSHLGLVTTTSKYKDCQLSEMPPYPKINHKNGKTMANSKIGDVWVSGNVANFLAIEQKYKNVPLIINPDTNVGIFQMTEKVIWPLLLGRMMMIAGRHNVMQSIQKFYDIDFSSYLNLEFDSAYLAFDLESAESRITKMINDNSNLITNSHKVYKTIAHELEAARWSLGKNFYNFFVKQIKQIPQRSFK